jgi:redox-sensitive bicupin YhaK (pirin superfamily)
MITIRKSDDRGHLDHGWLKTAHTFSFGHYYDPKFMGFRSLRVINDDTVAPGRGFGTHPHDNMEIITVVLSGALRHKDSMGHTQDLTPGEVQHMSAGTGIMHSEFNPSPTEAVHLYQIWIEPRSENVKPVYHQTRPAPAKNGLRLVASGDGAEGSIPINADARLYKGQLDAGRSIDVPLGHDRHAWVQVLHGEVTVNGQTLATGDGAAISGETTVSIGAASDAELLVFDLA